MYSTFACNKSVYNYMYCLYVCMYVWYMYAGRLYTDGVTDVTQLTIINTIKASGSVLVHNVFGSISRSCQLATLASRLISYACMQLVIIASRTQVVYVRTHTQLFRACKHSIGQHCACYIVHLFALLCCMLTRAS